MDLYYMSDNPERWCRICGAPVASIDFGTDDDTGLAYEIIECQSPTHEYVYKIEEDEDGEGNHEV